LLAPTKLYCRGVLAAKKAARIKGIANITGGAFYDKIPRIIPRGLAIEIYEGSWPVPEIFSLIQNKGNVDDREMYHTLNMGIGMVLVLEPGQVDKAASALLGCGLKPHIIGRVVKGNREVVIQ